MIDEEQLDIACIALQAAGVRYEVALAGGVALQVRQLVSRDTEDVDLFVARQKDVPRAAKAIEKALVSRGYRVGKIPGFADAQDMQDWMVVPPQSQRQIAVQVVHFPGIDLEHENVVDVGPVVTDRYAAVRKADAVLERSYPRDFGDLAAFVTPRTMPDGTVHPPLFKLPDVIRWAQEMNPDHPDPFVGFAMRQLDRMPDARLEPHVSAHMTVAQVREAFATMPRSPSLDDDPDFA